MLKLSDQVRVFTVYSMDALMDYCVEGGDTVSSLGAEFIMLVLSCTCPKDSSAEPESVFNGELVY